LRMPNFILVDFENVQPRDLAGVQDAQVRVFLGPHQTRIPVALAASLQRFGPDVEYIALETAGKNALDFQIAYYLGHLAAVNPTASFQIISRDTGFDPLIKHLKANGVRVRRSISIGDQGSAPVDRAIDLLKRQKASTPRTEKALRGVLRAYFRDHLSEGELSDVVAALQERGIARTEGKQMSLALPD
jgi:hypothetical protein